MGTQIRRAVGVGGPFIDVFPSPILAQTAPTSNDTNYPIGQEWIDKSEPPFVIYIHTGNGVWETGGNADATTTSFGIVQLATLTELQNGNAPSGAYVPTSNDVATVIAGVVAGAVPPANETQAGIAEIATQVETDAGVDDTRIVTPLKLANFVAAGGFPGSFTDLTATGAVSFTGATGGLTMTSTTASSLGVTGAGIDLTLDSAGGRVVVNGEEAAADAVRVVSAAGGLDVDVALQMNLVSSQNAADAIVINASAGGIDMTAAGAAGEDIDIVNTSGSINLTAGEVIATGMVLTASGLDINVTGAAARDIDITNTGGSIRIIATENVADAIVIQSDNAGIQILAPAAAPSEDIVITATGSSVRITSTENATDSINIESTLGGINILASGAAAGEDINLTATGSSINLSATENAALAITLNTNGGTSETIRVRNQQGTNAASVDISSTAGGLTLTGGLATADAVNIVASNAAGGIDIDAGTAGVIADTTGAISLDSAAASNFTVTGAFDLTVDTTAGSLNFSAGEAAADAINVDAAAGGLDVDVALQMNLDSSQAAVNAVRVIASNAAGGIDVDAGTGGITIDTTGALSLDSAAASNFTVTGAFDLSLISSAGSVNITAGEDAADAIVLSAGAGGIDILATGAAGQDIDVINTGGSVNIRATESAVDSVVIESTAGGVQILASGAAAGEDILVTATGSSITITATENVTDALNLTASGAASRLNLTAGTGSIQLASGLIVPVTTKATADSPYTVLGTDYLINCDTSAGVLTVTLPAASAVAGRTFVIRDGAGSAAVNNITIGGGGTNLVGGGAAAATKTLSAAYSGATVYSNGTVWLYAYVA